MTELGEFRRWSTQTAERLAAEPGRLRLLAFLTDLQALNGDLLDVCDALKEIATGSAWDLPRKLRHYARLLPDPLRHVRSRLRGIRERYRD